MELMWVPQTRSIVLKILDMMLIHVEKWCRFDVDSNNLANCIHNGECNAARMGLVISNDNDCEKLSNPDSSTLLSTSITVNAGRCNSLTISNNTLLKSVAVENGYRYYSSSSGSYTYYGGCVNVKRVYLTSLIDLIQLIRSSSINNIHYRIIFIL